MSRLISWSGEDHIHPPTPPLTAWSRSVSSSDHGVLRGPICDTDRGLWSLLPGPDHVGGDLRRVMEVIVLRGLKPQPRPPPRGINGTDSDPFLPSAFVPQIHPLGAIHHPAQLLPVHRLLQHIDPGWTNADPQRGEYRRVLFLENPGVYGEMMVLWRDERPFLPQPGC